MLYVFGRVSHGRNFYAYLPHAVMLPNQCGGGPLKVSPLPFMFFLETCAGLKEDHEHQ